MSAGQPIRLQYGVKFHARLIQLSKQRRKKESPNGCKFGRIRTAGQLGSPRAHCPLTSTWCPVWPEMQTLWLTSP